jgi:tripartite-type tricarboxylate transporter receptor subunit TctC
MKRRTLGAMVFFILPLAALGQTPINSWAIEYPTKPITMVVPYSPGGGSDLGSKLIAEKVSEFLGQPIVSEYKPGAGGAVGAALVAKAKPDGYTLLVGSTTPLVVAPLVHEGLGYTLEDFVPICSYSKISLMINARPDGPWKTLKEFVQDAKANPGKFRYATYGAKSMAHLMMELFSKQAGIKLVHIPYDGSPKANAAVLGGHVEVSCTTGTGGLYEAGQLIMLATGDKDRVFPEVPTLMELGYPIDLPAIYSLCVPKGTPKEIVDKLYEAHVKAFEKYGKELAEKFRTVEMRPLFLGPQEILDKYRKDKETYSEIAKELGLLVQPPGR